MKNKIKYKITKLITMLIRTFGTIGNNWEHLVHNIRNIKPHHYCVGSISPLPGSVNKNVGQVRTLTGAYFAGWRQIV